MMNIDNDNYEIWLLRYAEQELTEAERAEVEQWLEAHHEAAEELALYTEAPRLERNTNVRYVAVPRQHTPVVPRQHTPVPRQHTLWGAAMRWAAAAAVVLTLMLPGLRGVPSPAPRLIADNTTSKQQESLEPTEPLEIAEPLIQPRRTKATLIAKADTQPLPSQQPIETQAPQEPLDQLVSQDSIVPLEQPAPKYVDNLIVYDDTPEPEVTIIEEYAAAEVVYTRTESGVNPVGLFISTFIKANK